MFFRDDTIAAISTPAGSGGIAVIRISGPRAISIADSFFEGKSRLIRAESHRAYLGKIFNSMEGDKGFLDEALAMVFRAPNSYTKEDVVEISCHGGQYLSNRILELVLDGGARLAEPGEFTLRAFLNGRLDLSQAEAVSDIISAKTDLGLRSALSQFQGALSQKVKKIRDGLMEICSLLELELDFVEEDVEFVNRDEIASKIKQTIGDIENFLDTYQRGKILREGAKLVIIGKPNVGKSSLLNTLLKEERAIVTDVPGTTRDALEEQLDIRGVLFRVVDTAGVRTTTDHVEKLGVERSVRELRTADIALVLFDGSNVLEEYDEELIDLIGSNQNSHKKATIVAINKIDLPRKLSKREIHRRFQPEEEVLEISAKEHLGIPKLEDALIKKTVGSERINGAPMLTNIRQKRIFEQALDSITAALESLNRGLSSEFVAVDLRRALDCLGEFIGEVTTEDLLGNIFSKFCIGK